MQSSKPLSMIYQGQQQTVVRIALSFGYKDNGRHSNSTQGPGVGEAALFKLYGHSKNGTTEIASLDIPTNSSYIANQYAACILDDIAVPVEYPYVSWKVVRGGSQFKKLFDGPQFIFDVQKLSDMIDDEVRA